ncbi:S8 family peptidase [Anaerocolumna sp. MB42-C2]|uniref:S8 family peptidase n=1 Tax=Anaerocolumna sp. MB42-C2 TaxID=3070997 RepID=UPI0027DFB6E0|nr:S8 family peptidase [Anaerocolumna sp. MB42-C2]WMJ86725.1 S8 family peptidase [Anaerocolumna sp. MB42-C2]
MTLEEKKMIYSSDYANAIVEYKRSDSFLQQFNNYSLNIIDEKYGVVYFPFSQATIPIKTENGYAVIPKLYGLLDTISLDAMGVTKTQNIPRLSLKGEGVLLGFVDTGIDYNNPIFKNADNTTRIVSIWDQTIENSDAGEDTFNFGLKFNREAINSALQSENPYSVVPSTDENGHGTMLAGIAGGSADEANDFTGIVPRSEFVIVKLKQAKKSLRDYFYIPDDANCFQEDDIMFGIKYLVNVASELKRPIAICIGLGTNQGAHDGYDTLSNFIGWTGNFTGTCILVAAGNEGNGKKHYYGKVEPATGSNTVELNVGANEKGFSMELWGYAQATYSIDIMSPSGEYIPKIVARLGENRTIRFLFDNTTVYVDYLVIEAQSGNPLILVRFVTPAPGIWRFKVYGGGSSNRGFHVWLPMTGFISDNTYFLNSNPDTTITAPGNTQLVVTVTAYNPSTQNIYLSSSRGYTADSSIKPDVAAPGTDVLAPVPGNQYSRVSGTSIAAAHATGVSAMLLEWGIVQANYNTISSVQIQRFLLRGVDTQSSNTYPNNVWGYGTINIYNTFFSLSSSMF